MACGSGSGTYVHGGHSVSQEGAETLLPPLAFGTPNEQGTCPLPVTAATMVGTAPSERSYLAQRP